MRDIGEHCVAAAETVSRGDPGIGPGSGGRKGGSPPCPGQRKQLPGTYFRLHASNHRPYAVETGDEKGPQPAPSYGSLIYGHSKYVDSGFSDFCWKSAGHL